MSATEKFADAVSSLFSSKEKGLQRDLRKAEKKRQQIESEKQIARTHASLLDRREIVSAQFAAQCSELRQFSFSPKDAAQSKVNGASPALIGANLAAASAIAQNIEAIEKELRLLLVAPSEKALADFERANAAIIKRIPKPKKAPEQLFTPPKPVDEWGYQPPTALQTLCGAMAEEID